MIGHIGVSAQRIIERDAHFSNSCIS